jgi:hypothetical protein
MDNANETYIFKNVVLESSIFETAILEVFIADDSFLMQILR